MILLYYFYTTSARAPTKRIIYEILQGFNARAPPTKRIYYIDFTGARLLISAYTVHAYMHILYSDANDPSAGSPTDALLRLLFPLDHPVRISCHTRERAIPYTHRVVHR